MFTITSLTEEPKQKHILPIEGGYDDAEMTLEFKETQNSWFMTLTWGERSVNNLRVSTSPNILSQYKSSFPFGIMVFSPVFQDPLTLEAFTSGGVEISIMTEAEVEEVEATVYGA